MINTFERIKANKKIHDYLNFSEPEVKLSVFFTFLITLFLFYIDMYNDFNYFQEGILNLILCVIGGFIGLLGLSLSGIAIITSLFTKEDLITIDKYNPKGTLDKIISSFLFHSLNIGISIIMLILCYLALISPKPLINIYLFWCIFIVIIYFNLFILFYTVSLVDNCISLYKIKYMYDELSMLSKSLYDEINEIRIDYLITKLMKYKEYDLTEIEKEIEELINLSDYSNKDRLINYIRDVYGKSNNTK